MPGAFDDLIPAQPSQEPSAQPAPQGDIPPAPPGTPIDSVPTELTIEKAVSPEESARYAASRAAASQPQAAASPDAAPVASGAFDDLIPAGGDTSKNPALDALESIPTGLGHLAAGLIGLPGDLLNLGKAASVGLGKFAYGIAGAKYQDNGSDPRALPDGFQVPDSDDANAVIQQLFGKYHTPQTAAGKTVDTIAQFLPAAYGGEATPLMRVARVVVPGASSEAAGELSDGNPFARVLGGFAGAGALGALSGIVRPAEQVIASASKAATPSILDRADQLMQASVTQGQPLTKAEAIDSASGGATQLGRIVRSVEATQRGKQGLAPFYAARPAQTRQAVSDLADSIAPASSAPGVLGDAAQTAASTGIDRARQTVNAAAKPNYDQLPGQEMDPDQYDQLKANPSYAGALASLRSHPELGAELAGLPDNNLAVVNGVVKHLDTLGEQARGTVMAPGDLNLARLRGNARSLAADLASDASDGAGAPSSGPWAQARETVASGTRQYVDPLRLGPLGAMSSTPDLKSQLAALFPASPSEGAAAETGQAARVLNATDPGVLPQLTRAHIMDVFNGAAKRLQNGQPNTNSGPNFAKALAGNAEQEGVLNAGVSALPNGQETAGRLQSIIDTHRAMGTRLAEGSPTADKTEDLKALHTSKLGAVLGSVDIARPGEGLEHILNSIAARRRVDQIVAWLKDPNGLTTMPTKAAPLFPVMPLLPSAMQGAR